MGWYRKTHAFRVNIPTQQTFFGGPSGITFVQFGLRNYLAARRVWRVFEDGIDIL